MITQQAIADFPTSQQKGEPPKPAVHHCKGQLNHQTFQTIKLTQISSPNMVQIEARVPNNSWHPSSWNNTSKRIITAKQFILFINWNKINYTDK
jgi:hypothetical protein